MEGDTLDVVSSGARLSRPQTDITLPQGPGAKPVLPDLNETSKEQRAEELKIKVQELDLKALTETKEDLRMWMDKYSARRLNTKPGGPRPANSPLRICRNRRALMTTHPSKADIGEGLSTSEEAIDSNSSSCSIGVLSGSILSSQVVSEPTSFNSVYALREDESDDSASISSGTVSSKANVESDMVLVP
ncbi:hypothetical protein COLO4_34239 [Corchorus olitorius]|uniref:Uncharacterized protein n=1 Tax=Corchorus olitorius TaxID=93759 RepID=A0A1R3GMQ0_9ROSI|nr:hypothetical protein COLO4_34239 [Corchorus olitorius]